jgi:hypothetical protein
MTFRRALGRSDATMVVIGGIVPIACGVVTVTVVLRVVWADPAGAPGATLLLAAAMPVYCWFSRCTR